MNRSVLVAVNDLFFVGKIRSVAEQLGIRLTIVKQPDEVLAHVREAIPALMILDLSDARLQPLDLIGQIKSDAHLAGIKIIGFYSHVQVDLYKQATDAGCDQVLAKSAFSQMLPALLSQLA
ncbi:MAG: response regulator [Acidobacteriota bacterium]|nr:response regulator [Blastocatellia bacterium]MDW8241147.1 response regulator [Acidobacteriota bacterium]